MGELDTHLHIYLTLHGPMHLNLNPRGRTVYMFSLVSGTFPESYPLPTPTPTVWGTICLLLPTRFAPSHEVQELCVPTCLQKGASMSPGPGIITWVGGSIGGCLSFSTFSDSKPSCVCFIPVRVCFSNVRLSGLYLLGHEWAPFVRLFSWVP